MHVRAELLGHAQALLVGVEIGDAAGAERPRGVDGVEADARGAAPTMRTSAPGRRSSGWATVRQPSGTLSLTLATVTGASSSGIGTSM